MKILVSDTPPYFIDVTAPVLGATEVTVDGRVLWRVWCKHCLHHHYHGPAEGHREAHCQGPTPYSVSGYNLALADSGQSQMNMAIPDFQSLMLPFIRFAADGEMEDRRSRSQ